MSNAISCGCGRLKNAPTARQGRKKTGTKREVIKKGLRSGKLVVVKEVPKPDHIVKTSARYVECKCDCGSSFITRIDNVKRGWVTSCGCTRSKPVTMYGFEPANNEHRKAIYRLWLRFRHIKENTFVTPKWSNYLAFSKWALEADHKPGLNLCRIVPGEGYTEENCYWASGDEYKRLVRSKVWDITSPDQITYKNVVNLFRFCKRWGLSDSSMYKVSTGKLLSYKGWTVTQVSEDAFEFEQDPEAPKHKEEYR